MVLLADDTGGHSSMACLPTGFERPRVPNFDDKAAVDKRQVCRRDVTAVVRPQPGLRRPEEKDVAGVTATTQSVDDSNPLVSRTTATLFASSGCKPPREKDFGEEIAPTHPSKERLESILAPLALRIPRKAKPPSRSSGLKSSASCHHFSSTL